MFRLPLSTNENHWESAIANDVPVDLWAKIPASQACHGRQEEFPFLL